jgi:hypothetical protein
MITVERASEDGLSARVWQFRTHSDLLGALYLNLIRYAEGTRKTRRHKLAGEQWESNDERYYNSKLPRPTSIPDDVIAEAMQKMLVKVSIGWTRQESVIATRKVA